jgi:hypothetical protein
MEWAPRVSQEDIRQLYENDAQGIYDEELLNNLGWALYSRCDSFITAVEAARGRATCPTCAGVIRHHRRPDEILHCAACGWEMPWQTYFQSFQHQQLSGAEPVLVFFREYMQRFPNAKQPAQKMLLIDQLIHGFHYCAQPDRNDPSLVPTRTTAINLIQGRYHEVVVFLDRLTYTQLSTPGIQQTHSAWRQTINQVAEAWHDDSLRREP